MEKCRVYTVLLYAATWQNENVVCIYGASISRDIIGGCIWGNIMGRKCIGYNIRVYMQRHDRI